jgi:hypothetical protein
VHALVAWPHTLVAYRHFALPLRCQAMYGGLAGGRCFGVVDLLCYLLYGLYWLAGLGESSRPNESEEVKVQLCARFLLLSVSEHKLALNLSLPTILS